MTDVSQVTRFEVIDESGRTYVRYGVEVTLDLQDDGRTLKVFVSAMEPKCICTRFSDTGGYRIADLMCPIHGANGTEPGDGPWLA